MANGGTPPTNEALHKQLLAFAKVVDRLEQRVDALSAGDGNDADSGLKEQVERLRADLDESGDRLAEVEQAVKNLIRTTEQLVAGGGGEEPAPVAWVDVPPEAALTLLDELVAWINEVLVPYQPVVGPLHPCWYRHPPLVQLLLDLKAAWTLAYRHPTGEGRVFWALDWQERHLAHLKAELRTWKCSSVKHEPPRIDRVTPQQEDLKAYVKWWTTGRESGKEPPAPGPPARPAPTPQQYAPQQPGQYGQGQYGQPPGTQGWGQPR